MRLSLITTIKQSRPYHVALLHSCRLMLGGAKRSGHAGGLRGRRAIYALERRVREYLDRKTPWGIDSTTPALMRESFLVLREILALLIHHTEGDERRAHNRRLNQLEMLAKWPEVLSNPIRCYFETTDRCNLRCRMCGQSFFPQGRPNDMPVEAIEIMRPLFEFMDEVSLFGYGEGLLVGYIPQLLDAIPPHANSRLVTNGLLLTPERNKMLVEHGLKTLFISLDATTAETHKFVRGVEAFERILSNIRDLQAQKRAAGAEFPRLTLTFVAMRRNIEELPDFIRLARSLGIGDVIADYLTVYSEDMREQSLFYDRERSDRYVTEAIAVAENEDVKFSAPVRFSVPEDGKGRKPRCAEPWEFIYLRADGFVQPCCTNSDPMSSWRDTDFATYWNSPDYRELRRTIYTPEENAWCKGCLHVMYRDAMRESTHIHIMPESIAAGRS